MSNPWNREKPYDYSTSWIASDSYLALINRRYTGDVNKHWYNYRIEEYICVGDTKDKSVLLLGSNEGWMEIALRNAGFEGHIVATDIAERALARASEKCRRLCLTDIDHVTADLNVDRFPEASFDFVVAEGVLHHIENIKFCIEGIHRALKPDGLLIGAEYVGAFRFQFPERQVRWINAALAAIPAKYRPVESSGDGYLPLSEDMLRRVYYVHPTLEAMRAIDPSEAVSGHLLISSIESHFVKVEKKDGGGGIIMNIAGHFPFAQTNTDPECDAWLAVLALIEETLYKQNTVPSDLVFFVYRRS